MKKRLIAPLAILVALSSAAGIGIAAGQGEGHTPVFVCHWVPAHGGTYIRIVVDDDGANGNENLQAHAGHPNDLIGVSDCPTGDID